MTEWKSFWDQVYEEVKRLEPILRDRKIIPKQEERGTNSTADGPEPA